MKAIAASLMFVFLLLTPAKSAQVGECYFMLTFASQRPNLLGAPSHTYATFVRAVDDDGSPHVVESFTISWLPRDPNGGKVYYLRPEPGRNLDLPSTLRYSAESDMQVSVWGPFQIKCELYQRALAHRARLESGSVLYKSVDAGYRRENVSNCIHAVGDLSEESSRLRIPNPGWGNSATYFVTLQLLPWVICPDRTQDWVLDALGLTDQPILRRDLSSGNPTIGAVFNATQRIRHLSLQGARRD